MKLPKAHKTFLSHLALLLCLAPVASEAQVNSGSNGSDGALNPTQDITIDMADHPDGIYQYTSVNIPPGVSVYFVPNANNKPVVWLVQGSCVIGGGIHVEGQTNIRAVGGNGGPGGFKGGSGGTNPSAGSGPGGGRSGNLYGVNASYCTVGVSIDQTTVPSSVYGNSFLLPLVGGSGGGGSAYMEGGQPVGGGGGGGGAILIASSVSITLDGQIYASGNDGALYPGGGSGGAVRIVAPKVFGSGAIYAQGGYGGGYSNDRYGNSVLYFAGLGRVRFDVLENDFSGRVTGVFTQGFQPIILPLPSQGVQLSIGSVGGVAVAANPSGMLANPDVIVSAQQTNPISVVVTCTNIPLNSQITVKVHPANGGDVTAVGINNTGTQAASTATVAVNMPRGGGIIYASAVTGMANGGASKGNPADRKTRSLADTGWTAGGETFAAMEVTAGAGGKQTVAYLTKSGKRFLAN